MPGSATLDAQRRAAAILEVLSPFERRLIELAFYQGYTHGELSDLLEIPLGTIKTRIRNSLGKMRRARDAREPQGLMAMAAAD